MQKLSDAKAGKYMIKWVFTDPDHNRLLKEIGIEAGREVIVLENNRTGNMLIRSETGLFSVRPENLSGITV